MLVVLGLSGPLRAPDLQVEAATAVGASLPELADAVARALVAGGARVVLKGPTSGPCLYCAKVVVVQTGQGSCRVEVSQDRHKAGATLRLPPTSGLFDQARAIAIQARLLVTWETNPESKTKEVATRAPVRRNDATPSERAARLPEGTRFEPSAAWSGEPAVAPSSALEPPASPRSEPLALERPVATASVAPVEKPVAEAARPEPRSEPRPETRTEPRREPKPEARTEAGSDQRIDLGAARVSPAKSRWPWIPTAIGAAAAMAAGVCALAARDRYDALSDNRITFASAAAIKTEGERWQIASFVLAGAAVVGLGTGVVGFATRSPVVAVVAPVRGGGMIALSGELP
jgi:hypothetical protein